MMTRSEWLQANREVRAKRKQAEEDWEEAADKSNSVGVQKAQEEISRCDAKIKELELVQRLNKFTEDE